MHRPLRAERPTGLFRRATGATWQRRLLTGMFLSLLGTPAAWAQISGPKAIPGDYATVSAAITALNAGGVGAGGVTFNVAAGHTETASGLLITATGTQANPIVFQKSGSGANPRLTAGVGTSTTLDFVVGLAGADFVTFDGIDVAENAANTTATTQMESGYAMFRPAATDGCQNNVFRNLLVTLNKTNVNTVGIAGLASTATSATSVAATSPAGANSNNVVQGCVISNSATGINFAAASATVLANFDQNNLIGAAAGSTTGGNTIGNFGSSATGWGIGASQQSGLRIAGNTINSTRDYTSATSSTPVAASTVTSTLRGIFGNVGLSGSVDIVGNTITLASGATTSLMAGIENSIGSSGSTNTVNITGNTVTNCTYSTATTGAFTAIGNSATAGTVNVNDNQVTNNVIAGTGTVLLITGGSPTTLNMNGNTITGNVKQVAAGTASITMQCMVAGSAAVTANNNTITTNSIVTTGASTGAGTLYGYNQGSSPVSETLTGNTVTGLSISGTTTASTSIIAGIRSHGLSTTVQLFSQNVVGDLSITSTGVGSGSVNGIAMLTGGGTGSLISRNKVYNLSAAGTSGTVNGIVISGGATHTIANNLVGDLRAPAATGLVAVSGLQVSGGTGVNAYFNTIYLAPTSSGATFGSSGIFLNSTTPALDARNNIVVNKGTAAGTGGQTVALRRTSGTTGVAPSNYLSTSNNNLFFAGAPSATNLIYGEGTTTLTNALQTVAAFRALVGREASAVTEDVPFLSLTGTDATFLHISPSTPTQVESGGVAVSGITNDFDGDTRNATTPDLGADEGTFQALDLSAPVIVFTPLSSTTSTANRTLTTTITDPSGIATGANAPRLFFRKGTTGAFQSVGATSVSGNTYTFTFDFSLVGGVTALDPVQYYVVAQDASANNNVGSNPAGATFTTLPGTVYQFLIQSVLSGTYYVGTSTSPDPTRTYPTLSAAVTAYNNNSLGGAVTYLLLDANYSTAETFPIIIAPNIGASATNTLTIKPNTGVTTTLTGSNTTALIALNGADYVTLDGSNGGTISATDPRPSRNWTINNTNTGSTANGILMTVPTSGVETANFNTFQNLVITGGGSTTAQAGVIMLTAAANTAANNGNVVRNNLISNSLYGIYSLGVSAAIKNTGTVISQNDLNVVGTGAIGRFGITALFEDGIQVTENNVDGIASSSASDVYGISLGFTGYGNSTFTGSEVTNATVSRNYVGAVRQTSTYSAVGIGLAAATSGTSVISNNMVAGVVSNGTGSDFGAGIYVGGGTGSTTRVVFNSVNMTGALPTGVTTSGTQPSYALAVGGSTPTVEIRNNVLANTQVAGAAGLVSNAVGLGLAYSSTAGAYANLTSSHNNFFVGTGANTFVGRTGGLSNSTGTMRATLADLNTETGQDAPATSKVADPQFVSATDLHSTSPALNNAGTPVAGISVDFDGQTRSTTPDIGADEFSLFDVATTALTGPTAGQGCYSATEAVSVTIRNTATAPLDLTANPVTVSVTVTGGSASQTITATVNTGTLAAGATQVVAVGTVDLSAAGTYSLTASTTLTGDENAANNALATPLSISSTPRTAAFTFPAGSICAGSTTAVSPTLGTGFATGGTFSSTTGLTVDATTGAINPSTSTAGTYTVTYTLAASGNCPALTTTQSVTIAPAASSAFAYSGGTFCVSGTNPTATVTGTTGGTFSSATGLSIDAATGTINLTASTPGTYTVTYTVAGTCGSSSTQQVTITTAPAATFSYPTTGSYCAGSTATVAPAFGTGASAGAFSSTTGLTIDAATGVINLATSVAGTYTVTNTIAASGGCSAATATATVTINPAATATFTYPSASFCVGGTNPTATVTGTAGGTFSSTAGLSLNTTTGAINLSASTPGTYTVTYTAGTACPASATATVTITASAVAGFTYPATAYCVSNSSVVAPVLATGGTAGTFSSTTGLTLNATTGAITPGTSTPGTYTVTNTVAASGGCAAVTATFAVTVTAAPTAAFSYPTTGSFCAGSTATVTPTLATGATAGAYSSTTGLTINATTGVINLATSTAGTYTVTNTVAAAGGCAAVSSTATVTVNPAPARPTISVQYNGPVTTLTSSATTGNQWLLNGQPVTGATGQTYVINSAAQLGSYTVVTTSVQGCASQASLPLIITSTQRPLAGSRLDLYPNPTRDGRVTLELSGYSKVVRLTVLNALGQVVQQLEVPAGKPQQALDLRQLPAGVYILRATTDGGTDTRRIVRE